VKVRLLSLLVLGLLLVPSTTAQATPGIEVSRHRIDLVETADGMSVKETLTVLVKTATTFDGNITLWLPRSASNVAGTYTKSGATVNVPSDRLRVEAGATAFDDAKIKVRVEDLGGSYTDGEEFILALTYSVSGKAFAKDLHDAVGTLRVFATSDDESQIIVIGLGALQPTGAENQEHVIMTDLPEGFRVAVAFQVPAQEVSDFARYVWGLVGVLVGLFIMFVLVKQGWVTVARTKKFEKGGQMESNAMLEARRRTLMAALKELEVAHDAKQIADDAYAPLKEEYKAQAVRVLRSLEGKKGSSE
jgi:hypothetical protein